MIEKQLENKSINKNSNSLKSNSKKASYTKNKPFSKNESGRSGKPFGRDGDNRDRKPFGRDGDNRDRKPFGRDGDNRDRKPFGRDGDNRDRKPFGRDGDNRDRKPFGRDGDNRDRKPFGRDGDNRDRKPFGRDGDNRDRKPFGRDGDNRDRKPFGRDGDNRDRKPFGRDGDNRDRKPFGRDGDNRDRKPFGRDGDNRDRKPFGRDGDNRDRKPFGRDGDNRDRKPFGRDGDNRDRKPFGRDGDNRDRKPFGRDGDNRDRKPFGRDGDNRDRKPFGRDGDNRDRKPFGRDGDNRDRKPFGRDGDNRDRKPFGRDGDNRDRKPFGRDGDNRDRKPFGRDGDNRDRKPFGRDGDNRDRKPFGRDGDNRDRKPFGRDGDGDNRDRKPFGRDGDNRDRKPFGRDGDNRDRKPFGRDAGYNAKKKKDSSTKEDLGVESNNTIIPHLETLFESLYNGGGYKINQLLRQMSLAKSSDFHLNLVLELLQKFNIIKLAGEKFKLNIKYVPETKIPRYFLLKVSSENSLGEKLAVLPSFIKTANKFSIVLEKSHQNLNIGSYLLAKIAKVNNTILKATVLSVFPEYAPEFIVGLVSISDTKTSVIPLGRKYKVHFALKNPENITLNNNSLVKIEVTNRSFNNPEGTLTEVLSTDNLSDELSLITAYEFGLSTNFSEEVLENANSKSTLVQKENYIDLTNMNLVTIDGDDSKDFDDAVFVSQISENPVKYKATVAIADVSSYVEEGTSLDIEAKKRGNSTYLPGLVIPMLPEVLSNEWCSLNEEQKRSSLAVDLIINNEGLVEEYTFYKAIIKSKARLTYNEVENAINGKYTDKTKPLLESVIIPLYSCWKLLNEARQKRNALNITSTEYKVIIDKNTSEETLQKREELVSNKIIEELMIAANVAAAKFLKNNTNSKLAVYRIHDKPSDIKIEHFSSTLKSLNIKEKVPSTINTTFFNNLLNSYANNTTLYSVLNESVLESQSPARYSTYNIGHFGLALEEYCHFTSPIRRYADLIVHRLISNALDKKETILQKDELEEISNNISVTERNSSFAEYSAIEKIIAKILSKKIDSEFKATIVNITTAGAFVALEEMGAQGLIPMRTLGKERFIIDKDKNMLVGINTGISYKIGESLTVILKESNILKGLLTFVTKEYYNNN